LNGWWASVRMEDLQNRTDNARRSIADRYVLRGSLLDRNNAPIDITLGQSGSYTRSYDVPSLAPITGYTHPVYGQAGLEDTLDPYLRGLQGNPTTLIWWDHLLYGQPPPGLDVRTSLDLGIQARADQLLANHAGALVLINAQTGEVLAMASHPGYDPNQLDQLGATLAKDPGAPLLNRATQGQYEVGPLLKPFLGAYFGSAEPVTDPGLIRLFDGLGFYTSPAANVPVADPAAQGTLTNLRASPLQMALAAAALTGPGIRPAPWLILAVNTPSEGWVILPAPGKPVTVFRPAAAQQAARALAIEGQPFWEYIGLRTDPGAIAWYIAGTLPNWQGTPLAVVVALEKDSPAQAQLIGRGVLESAIKP